MTVDILTRIMRIAGISNEDAVKVRDMVAEETMQRYLDSQPTPEPPPEPPAPMPIVINVYIDERVREGITMGIAKAVNAGLCDAAQQLKRSLEV